MKSTVSVASPNPKSPLELYAYQKRWVEDLSPLKICTKARRIGYSFIAGLDAVLTCLERKTKVVVLSRGQRQSKEFIEESVAPHVRAAGAVAEFRNASMPETSIFKREVLFGNGSSIVALPANPDTARGSEGDIILDEFGFHQDARQIYEAIVPSITRGYKLSVISTPNGQQGAYYELAKEAGLVDGRAKGHRWSAHKTTILEAIKQGCLDRDGSPLDAKTIRASCYDEEMWLQEYMCQFLSLVSQWISPELFESCVSEDARDGALLDGDVGEFYAGWDIARNRDRSIVWILNKIGKSTITRAVIEFSNMPLPQQKREAMAIMSRCKRMALDKTGMGLALYEELEEKYYGLVEGVQFTLSTKEILAVHGKQQMEHHRVQIPDTDIIRNSFRSVKKITTATGQSRFDAEHDEKIGHADHWWAYCLAMSAALTPGHGLLDLWQEQAANIKDKPTIKRNEEQTPEGVQKQLDAQIDAGAKINPAVASVFGAQRSVVNQAKLDKKAEVVKTIVPCPKCGNANLASCGISMTEIEERCSCGFTRIVPRK